MNFSYLISTRNRGFMLISWQARFKESVTTFFLFNMCHVPPCDSFDTNFLKFFYHKNSEHPATSPAATSEIFFIFIFSLFYMNFLYYIFFIPYCHVVTSRLSLGFWVLFHNILQVGIQKTPKGIISWTFITNHI